MRKYASGIHNQIASKSTSMYYDEVDVCPICKKPIAPVYLDASITSANRASIFYFCRGCFNCFLTEYYIIRDANSTSNTTVYETKEIISSEPNRFVKQLFDSKIVKLSPQFDKIYNQALAAESAGLDEIAGLGYRKSLEFLIKDFAIHEYPDDAESIKTKPLAQCIKSYIDNPHITTLAERSAWIGNDEAHYIRKQESRDVSDMKSFIQAIVYFIGMILITEDAASMTPVK